MTPEDAVTLLNGMIFRPGWLVRAERFFSTDYPPNRGGVHITMLIDTVDSSYPSPSGRYGVGVTLQRKAIIEVGEDDQREDVLVKFLDAVHEIDEHEDRELLRVPSRGNDHLHGWYAPLHFHHVPGMIAWASAQLNKEKSGKRLPAAGAGGHPRPRPGRGLRGAAQRHEAIGDLRRPAGAGHGGRARVHLAGSRARLGDADLGAAGPRRADWQRIQGRGGDTDMIIHDEGRQLDVDPVMAAAAVLRHARNQEDPEDRKAGERLAYGILHRAAVVCHGCGVYGGEPHATWCDRAAGVDLVAYMAGKAAGNGGGTSGVDRSAAGNPGGKGDDEDEDRVEHPAAGTVLPGGDAVAEQEA